jgi:predicted alpha/beta hydrolase family esterase
MCGHTDLSPVIIVPGLGNSGPQHWQRLWQARLGTHAGAAEQQDWDRPDRAAWIQCLDDVIRHQPDPPVLVAHSLSCALVAHWAAAHHTEIAGALLVAPADTDSDAHTPPEAHVFRPMPRQPLLFPSIVVASRDDPYVAIDRARSFAAAWGSEFIDIGAAGHINPASGFGPWPLGEVLLERLRQNAVAPASQPL